jgi:tRNA-splicing ligase RtcB
MAARPSGGGTASNMSYEYHRGERHPIKAWTKGVQIEDQAMQQLRKTSQLPFIHKHIAVMPDVHWGMGATVGSVLATNGAIVPAAVGVDLGCGMMAVQTTLAASEMPDSLSQVRAGIEKRVPHGRTNNGKRGDRGAWGTQIPKPHEQRWLSLLDRFEKIINKHPRAKGFNGANHVGTLGTGNHFIEICLDENDSVWVILHSGSRGPGNRIGSYFIELAKQEMERYFIGEYLPDKDLSYFVEHTEHFEDYVEAVEWAQDFALENRKAMMESTLDAMREHLPRFSITDMAVNCHHNYVARENHFGANVWVTRKGAVRAREGDLGIIPGSMGTGSFIVRGKGNPESFCSCSHGAGRAMSRGEAKRTITLAQHAAAMRGIDARLDEDVLDESPAAYKDISAVMAAQDDLIEIVHRLRQIVNVKG